jgi:hypothetical protein
MEPLWTLEKILGLLPLPGIEFRFLDYPARIGSIQTELSQPANETFVIVTDLYELYDYYPCWVAFIVICQTGGVSLSFAWSPRSYSASNENGPKEIPGSYI